VKRIQEVTVQFSVDNGNTCSSIRLADPLPIQPVPVGYSQYLTLTQCLGSEFLDSGSGFGSSILG
jgi:hypothetical protein